MWRLQQQLGEIGGFPAVCLQPAAGAHGELTGILVVRAWHESRGDRERDEVIVPDSSHGTNPATASMAGFRTVTVASRPDGSVDLEALRAALGPRTAAVMLTNPSTLGLFERHVVELLEAVHAAGALAYMDGANMNAVLGHFRPGAAGFDIMHFNLHKTFSTPHGGGGPGAGPIAVARAPGALPARSTRGGGAGRQLSPRAPRGATLVHRPRCAPSRAARASWCAPSPTSVAHGGPGLRQVSDDAVLAANYLRARVGEAYQLPFEGPCKHEFVATAQAIKAETGVRTLDIAKRLIDYGYHPPTIYFPLIVEECMLIEPTETESIETLDAFADALIAVAEEARRDPDLLHGAPHDAPVRRLDEATAARQPDLRWQPLDGGSQPCPQ